jgi:hypothetical protein
LSARALALQIASKTREKTQSLQSFAPSAHCPIGCASDTIKGRVPPGRTSSWVCIVMIPPQELLSYLKAKPFRSFRIHMASGETFDVRHPEMVRVGRNSLMLFTFVSDHPEIYDQWETISLMLMERISLNDATVPPEGNGSK